MCLPITPSMVQLVAWPLSGARPKSEPEVCSFCWFIPSELFIFQCYYFARYFLLMDISLVSYLNELKHEHFVLPTQWLWILLRWSKYHVHFFMHIVTLLIYCCVKNKVFLNPESWNILMVTSWHGNICGPFVRGIFPSPLDSPHKGPVTRSFDAFLGARLSKRLDKQRVLMHGHQGWNVRHSLCHIYMIYVYIWVVYSFCLFCCLFSIVTTQFVALYKPCKPKPKPSTYDPPGQPPPGRDPKTDT